MKSAAMRTAFASLLLFVLANSVHAQDPDSLAYDSLRTRIAAIDSAHPALQTADALADAGLFTDATAILREHAPTWPASSLSSGHDQERSVRWRISSGVDYYHLEDIDTNTMTAEELRDYKRLTETPLSGWSRVKSTIQPEPAWINEITPEAYVSERKGRLSAAARIGRQGSLFRYEPSVKAEKWFRAGAADTMFAPGSGQPSDMGGAAMVLTATNAGSAPDAAVIWSAPVSADWEHYRKDQPGYEAYVEYGISPSVEIRPAGSHVGARLSAYGRYEDFYRGDSDTLDAARFSGRAEGFGRAEKWSALVSGAWLGDRYPHAARLEAIDRIEGSGRAEYRAAPFLTGRLRLRGMYEREQHSALDSDPGFRLSGSEMTLEPGLETALGDYLRITPLLLWERRWAHRHGNDYLWEARSSWEPGLRIGWSSAILEAALNGAFRAENIAADYEEYTADSRSLRAGAEASVNVGRLLSIHLFADYQYRVYAPYGGNGRVSENLTISAAATLRL